MSVPAVTAQRLHNAINEWYKLSCANASRRCFAVALEEVKRYNYNIMLLLLLEIVDRIKFHADSHYRRGAEWQKPI